MALLYRSKHSTGRQGSGAGHNRLLGRSFRVGGVGLDPCRSGPCVRTYTEAGRFAVCCGVARPASVELMGSSAAPMHGLNSAKRVHAVPRSPSAVAGSYLPNSAGKTSTAVSPNLNSTELGRRPRHLVEGGLGHVPGDSDARRPPPSTLTTGGLANVGSSGPRTRPPDRSVPGRGR